nr:MAG TPA: hypothetical protein [Caudoviricetes sp.]
MKIEISGEVKEIAEFAKIKQIQPRTISLELIPIQSRSQLKEVTGILLADFDRAIRKTVDLV